MEGPAPHELMEKVLSVCHGCDTRHVQFVIAYFLGTLWRDAPDTIAEDMKVIASGMQDVAKKGPIDFRLGNDDPL